MTSWLFFALLGPLCWAAGNVFDSALRRNYIHSDHAMMWLLGLSHLPLVLGIVAVKGFTMPPLGALWWMLCIGCMWVGGFFSYFKAMEYEDPSHVALFMQSTPLFTLLIAVIFLHERLGITHGGGFLLILIGGFLASIRPSAEKWHLSKALPLMVATSLTWAFSDVFYKYLSPEFSTFWDAFLVFSFGGFIFVLLTPLFRSKNAPPLTHYLRDLPRRAWIFLIISMCTNTLGSLAFAYALTLGKASLAAVIIGVQPLFTFSYGLILGQFLPDISPEDTRTRTLLLKGFAFATIVGGLSLLSTT